jgi:hypothetical protein
MHRQGFPDFAPSIHVNVIASKRVNVGGSSTLRSGVRRPGVLRHTFAFLTADVDPLTIAVSERSCRIEGFLAMNSLTINPNKKASLLGHCIRRKLRGATKQKSHGATVAVWQHSGGRIIGAGALPKCDGRHQHRLAFIADRVSGNSSRLVPARCDDGRDV